MKTILLILQLFIFCPVHSIAADTTWLNNKWQPCSKENAAYFSINKGKQQQLYYNNSNALLMKGSFSDERLLYKEGTFTWYFPDGKLKDSITYVHNSPRYLAHFHSNGQMKTLLLYNDSNRAVFVNSWNQDGSVSFIDTFYHDRKHNECNKDTAWLKGIIERETDSCWHLRFYYMTNNRLYINSYYKQRLCTTRIKDFEKYNEEGKLTDSSLYSLNGRRQEVWLFHHNCLISAYKKYDSLGKLSGTTVWDEYGNEQFIDPAIVYPSQPEGFRAWKNKVMMQINNDSSINWSKRSQYYGRVSIKLAIDSSGNLLSAYTRNPSPYPDLNSLILFVCRQYDKWKPGTVKGVRSSFIINCNFYFTGGKITGYQQTYL